MKRVAIRHEGVVAGPFGHDAGELMARWRQAELDLARSEARQDGLATLMFRGLAVLALVRTLEGRQN